MKYDDIKNRVGCFSIPIETIERYPDEVASIFKGMIVVRAERFLRTDRIYYHAMSMKFDELEEGEAARPYEIFFDRRVVERSLRLEEGEAARPYEISLIVADAKAESAPSEPEPKKINFREFL